MRHQKINVPVALCQIALSKNERNIRSYRALRLLILLKLSCDGTLSCDDKRIKHIIDKYFGSQKTFQRQFDIAVEMRWIWVSRNNIIHLRNFDEICRLHMVSSRHRVRVSCEHIITNSEAFFFTSVVGLKVRNNERGIGDKAESLSGDSISPFSFTLSSYFGIGVNSMAKLCGYSKGGAHNLKKIAIENGWMIAKPKRGFIKYGTEDLGVLKATFPKHADKIWKYRGSIWYWLNDEILTTIEFVSRKPKLIPFKTKVIHKKADTVAA